MGPRFTEGQVVRIAQRVHTGHMRTPHYVRGKTGRVTQIVGAKLNPEQLAYGQTGVPGKILYRVRFSQHDLWADYRGLPTDTLDVEIYEHWLEGVEGV